jgi:hypothetical protein
MPSYLARMRGVTLHHRSPRLAVVALVILTGVGAPAMARLCSKPLDVSGAMRRPDLLARTEEGHERPHAVHGVLVSFVEAAWMVKQRDELAYPARAMLGTILEVVGCSPIAAAFQWIKAGFHAQSEAQRERVARGLAAARQRSPEPTEFRERLCDYLRKGGDHPGMDRVISKAELDCPGTASRSVEPRTP